MRILTLLILLLINLSGSSATLYSIASGDWNNNIWSKIGCGGATCNCTPATGDVVIICSGTIVRLNNNLIIGSGGGNPITVTIQSGATLDLNNKNLEVKTGGTLNVYGTIKNIGDAIFDNGSIINTYSGSAFNIKGNFENKNNSDQVQVSGTITVGGNFINGNGGAITGTGSITVSGTSSGAGTVFGGPTTGNNFSGGGLPIGLKSFKVEKQSDFCILSWTVTYEKNNNYFTIERSSDLLNWQILHKTQGAGTINIETTYTYVDNDLYTGVAYYRLSQTDFDGTTTFFDVISANRPAKDIYRIINYLGQDVDINEIGFKIIVYKDGTTTKVFTSQN